MAMDNFDIDMTEFEDEMEFEESTAAPGDEVAATPLEDLPGFDTTAGTTWIYPSNMSHRDYQFNIVEACLFKNTLVCLPTGLGKTFIAAVVMYNFYRWYPRGKVVFMAPTKPLVAQQIEACFKIMGIPQSDTKEMTGNTHVAERKRAWTTKRVFFLTPQIMSNDLSRGLFPARDIKLLIVDEAHKAQGDYAYCQVVKEMVRAEAAARIVALSATPGTDIPSVRSMLQNLCISHIELRQEDSPDILPFTHTRVVDKIIVPLDSDIAAVKQKLLGVIEIYTKKLSSAKAVRKGHNPAYYSKYALVKEREGWRQDPPANLASNIRGQVEGDFATVIRLYHGMELLNNQGLRSFYNFCVKEPEQGERSLKRIKGELGRIPLWRDILATLAEKFSEDASNSILNQGPVLSQPGTSFRSVGQEISTSHPKMEKLLEVVKEHFEKFSQMKTETRVMIFSQYRDCVTELQACLDSLKPVVRPMAFVGQAGTGGKKGLTQKEQKEVVTRFREGGYNTIVATCVAEEGLDIGEVDLIVLYDVAKSPIRLVQRMGRTGRKRDGRIVVLLTEGAEERAYNQSMCNKKAIHKAIMDKEKLETAMFLNCPRMIPRGLVPRCHKMRMLQDQWQQNESDGSRSKSVSGYMRRGDKYDLFKANCGFLTAVEEERWNSIEKFTGTVKSLGESREMWSEAKPDSVQIIDADNDQHLFDLKDYSLWQSGNQNRRFVSAGALSVVFSEIINMKHNKEVLKSQIESRKREKRPSGEARNSIMNYFRPSQNKSPNVFDDRHGKEEVHDLEIIIEENDQGDNFHLQVEDACQQIEMNISSERQDKLDDPSVTCRGSGSGYEPPRSFEDDLINDLLPEQDSGVWSPSSSPVSIKTLVDNPPSKEDVDKFDVRNAMQKAMIKYGLSGNSRDEHECKSQLNVSNFSVPRQSLIVAPVEKNNKNESIEDLFADSINLEDINFSDNANNDNEDKAIPINIDSQFDLGSPILEVQEDNIVTGIQESKEINDGGANNVTSQFDLGSPILEEQQEEALKVDKFSVFDIGSPGLQEQSEKSDREVATRKENNEAAMAEFEFGSPVMDEDEKLSFDNNSPAIIDEPEKFRPPSHTSTPIVSVGSSLRKSTIRKQVEDVPVRDSEVLKNVTAAAGNANESEDMFGDGSDDYLFEGLDTLPKINSEKSMFSATQIIGMMNTPDKKTSAPRKKLSLVFNDDDEDDNKENHSSSPQTTSQFQSQDVQNSLTSADRDESSKVSSLLLEGHHNLDGRNVSSERDRVANEGSVIVCPSCNVQLPPAEDINDHLDLCLNAEVIHELTGLGSPAAVSPPSSPLVRRGRAQVAALPSQTCRASPDTAADQPESSEDESIRRRVKKTNNASNVSSSDDEPIRSRVKKKGLGRQFIDTQVELSGESGSEDEAVASQDGYDQSFVDDATQDDDAAIYLRSVRSPVFRKPESRALPPITDDIFSQQVDNSDDYYEEDSFCVGDSMVENDSHYDTLDILEQRAEMNKYSKDKQHKLQPSALQTKGKRKRIIVHSSDEDTFSADKSKEHSPIVSEIKRKRVLDSVLTSDDETVNTSTRLERSEDGGHNDVSDVDFLSESTIESKKLTVIVSNSEVNKSQEVISSLRHLHGLRVMMDRLDLVTFVTGRDSAVVRMSEADFSLGTNKDKLVKRLKDIRECYSDVTIVVEWERVRPGERPRAQARTKLQDLIQAQVVAAGLRLLFSSSQLDTAEAVAGLVTASELPLPRAKFTEWQQQMVAWLRQMPGVGLGSAYFLAVTFTSLRDLASSSADVLMRRGVSKSLSEKLVIFFSKPFQSAQTDAAPL